MSVIGNPIMVGGSKDVFALISVTYPAGSVCTASNGIVTLTAGDTSGQAEFEIPTPASLPETWTISITDGNKTQSKTVSISQKWQIEAVTLAFRIYLYNHGDPCTQNSGGWTTQKGASLQSDRIQLNGVVSSPYSVAWSGSIDLTAFDTFHAEGYITSAYSGNNISMAGSGILSNDNKEVVDLDVLGTGVYDKTVDIGNLSGEFYIRWGAGAATQCVFYITEVYVE